VTLDLLRFTTAGSVDDGKSTLIGRLLYDSKQVFEDQLEHVAQASARRGGSGALDLALLTDGLRAEREQGITIDVAYRYFATARRRFIIADCPGHQQYTRNMVTGASTADVAVVLIDARRGVLEQSKRHAFISALLGIPQMVVAINKMDLVDFSRERYEELVEEFEAFARKLRGGRNPRHTQTSYIPISALEGDNVVERSPRMEWYEDQPLLEFLEEVEVAYDHPYDKQARFPVQWVIRPANGATRPGESGDYRGYAGQLASGALRVGEEVVALPSGLRTRIAAIDTFEGELEEAGADVGDAAPGGRAGRLARGADLPRGGGTHGEQGAAGRCVLAERAPAARGGPVRDQAHHARRDGDRGRAPGRGGRAHAGARQRSRAAGAQRHRQGAPAHQHPAGVRLLPFQPPHGQLHPDRRDHQRDGRRGDGWGRLRKRAPRQPSRPAQPGLPHRFERPARVDLRLRNSSIRAAPLFDGHSSLARQIELKRANRR
jgi:sulfate adenylyltransferase large subunit